MTAPMLGQRLEPSYVGDFRLSRTGWSVTVTVLDLARHVAKLLDGELHARPGQTEISVTVREVPVLLLGGGAARLDWHRGNASPACDGRTRASRPCSCPASFEARRSAARQGRGCEPHARIEFSLADAPLLGLFRFASGNWSFAQAVGTAATALRDRHDVMAAWLRREERVTALASGQLAVVSRPVLAIDEQR
jgi:hypothetical protein